MTRRTTFTFFAVAVLAAFALTFAAASPASSASKGAVIPIIMKDPGCHWFRVAGKDRIRLVVHGATTFRNLDEDAVLVKGSNFTRRVAVHKLFTISRAGVYHITMVGQHADDNHLTLVVK